MSKKKWIALLVCLQIITVILSVSITCMLENEKPETVIGVSNLIIGRIVFIGAPIHDANMEKGYIVYVQEEGRELLRTILITPDTWLFDGQGGAIWEKCLNFIVPHSSHYFIIHYLI